MRIIATGKYDNLNNQDYWKQRSLELMDEKFNDLKVVEKELQSAYNIALNDVTKELQAFITQYATDNQLTYAEAIQSLNTYEIVNYQARMSQLQQQLKNGNPFASGEIERLLQQVKYDRLSYLFFNLDTRLIELAGSAQLTFETWLSGLYESVYYQTGYNISVGTGIGVAMNRLNEAVVKEAITYPWSGQMFSERIWTNRNQLVTQLRSTITNGLIRGSSVQKMSRELAVKMDSSYKNSLRLIRTESAAVIGDATSKSYENLGVGQYQFIATLDNRTSKVCSSLDTKVYKLSDKQVGVNYPPMHPNCRSAVVPYFNNRKQAELRRARETGQNEIIPNMSYNDWKNKYVK